MTNQILNIKLFTAALYGLAFMTFLGGCEEEPDALFKILSSRSTNITFSNQIQETEAFNILEYINMYNGGGVGAGDINNDGWVDLYFTSNQGLDRLYLNKGGLKFEDITAQAGVGGQTGESTWTTGVTMVDINADGWLDMYVCQMSGYKQLLGRNRLYINNRDNTFTESAAAYGLDIASYAQHAAFFDYDKDGDLDMYLLNQAVHTLESYQRVELRTTRDSLAGDRLFQNEGGKFRDVSEAAGIFGGSMGYGLAISIGDVNNDTWPDIYVSNDFHENDYLYYNNGDGTFKENIIGSMGHVSTSSMGNDIADFNNDGWMDIISLDMKPADESIFKQSSGVDPYDTYQYKLQFGYHYQYGRNMLQLNAGHLFGENEVQFSEIGQLAGIDATDWSWSVFFADLDNNGAKDLFITNGIPRRPNNLDFTNFTSDEYLKADSTSSLALISLIPEGKLGNMAFSNKGLRFEEVSDQWGLGFQGFSNGSVPVDLDNDGDLDIVINNLNAKVSIFKNQSNEKEANFFLKVKLHGNPKNPLGIGARVRLETESGLQVQEFYTTKGWLSSVVDGLHFGLGKTERVQKLSVQWADGSIQEMTDVAANGTLTLNQADATTAGEGRKQDKIVSWIENVSNHSGIAFSHRENYFIDFYIERLLPHLLSTEGPKIAVGDINGDGLDDFFIGGAKGQAGGLFLQQESKESWFVAGDQSVFENHRFSEDVGATFADVDNDKDLDLYVVSGGSEPDKSVHMQDRLYLNDGSGRFRSAPEALPEIRYNGSCVVPGDFNEDGFVDFFVGGRSTPHEYGNPGVSRILINNRNGTYSDQTSGFLSNKGRIGLVTDAVWLQDTKELVIVGEWMPITMYRYYRDSATITTLPNSSGWWNTVHTEDLDNDGDLDFLVGNIGLNTNLSASPTEPLDLYIKDYDLNFTFDPIIAYYKQGRQWVYPGLNELAKQIVNVKRTYRTYEKYASSSFSEIFPEEQLQKSLHLQVQTLASVWVKNLGQNRYEVHELPIEAQFSPIYGFATHDFDGDGHKDVMAVGNFYGNQARMGKCDASFGTYLKGNGQGNFKVVKHQESGFAVYGEARDIKMIHGNLPESLILISRNNAETRLFKAKN